MAANQFRAAWNPTTHSGRIKLYTDNDEKVMMELDDAAEFTAILTLLSTAETIRIRDGFIQTGVEDIDGD